MPEFFSHYGSEEQCSSPLKALRWLQGFHRQHCNASTATPALQRH